ncbi:MAG: patatin-like phospholipase family protein [Gemmatimonadaceae bacterium]|nr:patatin-like phospholipase family protein [Gemmatimonadaceae bacterium]
MPPRPARVAALCAALLAAALPLVAQRPTGAVPLPPVATAAAAAAPGPACQGGSLALVLPGGGVKGIAHIGVIQILDSLGIRPDLVVGTSMGAIVGALYASGWTGYEMEALAKRFPVASAIGLQTYFRTPRSLGTAPTLLRWEQGARGLTLDLGAADETRVNNLVSALMLRGNLLARGDFDRLPIPFRAVATDLVTGKRVVLGRGDLARAVRTSFAIPLVFQPLADSSGHPLVDGGIAENVPVDVARGLGARRVLVSQLLDTLITVEPTGASIAARMMGLLFQQNAPVLRPGDVEVVSDVSGQSNLDFADATIEAMLERGRGAARRLLADSCLPRGARARGVLPPVARAAVVEGTGRAGRRLVVTTLGLTPSAAIELDTVMTRLDRLSEAEAVRAVWLNPQPRGDSVVFAPVLRYAPRRVIGAGIAIDGDYGPRGWFGITDRRLFHDRIEGAVRGTLGEFRQDLEFSARRAYENPEFEASPFLSLTYGHEQVRRFAPNGDELPRSTIPDIREAVLRVGWEVPFGPRFGLRAGLVGRQWRGDPADPGVRSTAGLGARLTGSWPAQRRTLVAEAEATPRFIRTTVVASALLERGRLTVTPTLRAAWMNERAPPHLQLPLGDRDGFAGLRIGERLGVAQLYAAADASWGIFGPLDAVATVMVGQSARDAARPLAGGWITGARLGVGAETPIGPLRVQYGFNDADRNLWFLRLGRWF